LKFLHYATGWIPIRAIVHPGPRVSSGLRRELLDFIAHQILCYIENGPKSGALINDFIELQKPPAPQVITQHIESLKATRRAGSDLIGSDLIFTYFAMKMAHYLMYRDF